MVLSFGAAYAAPNESTTLLYCYRSPKTVLNPPVNGKIHGLFKAFECFSSTFQGRFNLQSLFKTVLYIQVLFKPVQTLSIYKSILDPTLVRALTWNLRPLHVGTNVINLQ